MSINRVRFNDSASDSGAYTLLVNPVKVNLLDSDLQSGLSSIDNNPIWQKSKYDNRTRKLIWRGFKLGSSKTVHVNFVSQLAELKGYIGSEKYMNLRSIAIPNSKLSSGYHKIFISDVVTKLRESTGEMQYDIVELHFQILEAQ